MPYLIDGHNLIGVLPQIDLDDPHDEARLVLLLRAWAGQKRRRKAVVVFDGGLPGGYSRTLSTPSVEVRFAARQHSNADRVIRAYLRQLPDPGNWTVVSADHEVQAAARQQGARVVTPGTFAEQLARDSRAEREKPERISPAEVQAWLEVFAEPEEAPDAPAPKRGRTARSIGAQLGRAVPAAPVPPGEKPAEVSSAEVEAWLAHFPETNEEPRPYQPPPRPTPPKQEPTLTVDKKRADGLSEDEVAAWLEIFPEVEETPPSESTPTGADNEEVDEELALWRRLYGEKPSLKRGKRKR